LTDREEAHRALARFLDLNKAGKLQSSEARELLTGEALSHWSTETIGPFVGTPDTLITISKGASVARVPVTAPNGEVKDFYFYLERDPGWKIAAMRSLALPGVLYMVRDMEPADVAATPGGAYMVENARLTLLSDSELRSWFAKHSDELSRIAALVGESPNDRHRVEPAESNETPIAKGLRGLALSSARRLPNGAEIVVGGIIDNSVGFLCLRSGAPPPISPSRYIWIESLGGGWYLFRTT
jgi:hypothetical protein